MIVGIALDGEGWPLCCEMWPGNTTDVKTLLPVVDRMKRRFRVRELCVMADRAMISRKTLSELEEADPPARYIPGARVRRQKEASEKVLKSRGAWQEVHPERTSSRDPAPLKIREIERSAQNRSFDEEPMPTLNSEALDFRAASELFAGRRKVSRKDIETLGLITMYHGRKVLTHGGGG
ncbi:MAG: transposase, partial [Verrucomicrobiota bacterium]|nr:transposase [Verrucomicrobiota bacterium]